VIHSLFLLILAQINFRIAGPNETKNRARRGVFRLVQIRLAAPSFEKTSSCVKVNSPQARIAASSSVNAVALPFGRLWYTKVADAIGYPKFDSRSHAAVIRVYDDAGNVIETHEHSRDFKE
jgi:hypothetical protein